MRKGNVLVAAGLASFGFWLLTRKVSGAVEFVCPYCDAVFGTYEELAAHIEQSHPLEPPPERSNLYGVVTDSATNAPLGAVAVRAEIETPVGEVPLPGMPPYKETDSNGFYEFEGLMPGAYTIHFESLGGWASYEYKTVKINLRQGDNELNVNLVLLPEPPSPPEYEPDFYIEMTRKMYPTIEPYTVCKVWFKITNCGDGPGVYSVHIWDSVGNVDTIIDVALASGEAYTWRRAQWIDFGGLGSYKVEAQGDWANNNYAKATFP